MNARRTFRSIFPPLLIITTAALVAVGCGSSGSGSKKSETKLSLVSYSTPKEAYAKLLPAFAKTGAGEGVTFEQSYGASGDQSRAVEAGLNADVVNFSLEPDMTRLVDAKKVAGDWSAGKYKGMVTDSVVVFVVRKGNPKKVKTWNDLTKKGTEIVTPNPFTSGGARWNLMAGYGAQLHAGKSDAEAFAYLKDLLGNTAVQPASAREALSVFSQGKGDVLLSYENEAIFAKLKGEDIDFVVPDTTILIENPLAVSTTSKHPGQAKAFVEYALSAPAQEIYGDNGYRPVDADVLKTFDFPTPNDLFTIADLGGWPKVMDTFFDKDHGSLLEVEQNLGQATSK
ncbi:MAG: sulfate ABC transporter substrate-binding protein [Thermoleophilia bacterium]|nr:sulfate ABC transporter substrate-binding protein [Thermoleophilia bacterium]